MMFSETACSMKRLGAMIGTLPLASIASSITPRAPPQWSVWVWVKITAATGRLPRCWKYSSIAAAAPSIEVRVSTTMTPVSPSISVMLAMSRPRT